MKGANYTVWRGGEEVGEEGCEKEGEYEEG